MSDLAIGMIIVGSMLGYAFVAGIVHGAATGLDNGPRDAAALFWPIFVSVSLTLAAFAAPVKAGSWLVGRVRARRHGSRLPRMEVRR